LGFAGVLCRDQRKLPDHRFGRGSPGDGARKKQFRLVFRKISPWAMPGYVTGIAVFMAQAFLSGALCAKESFRFGLTANLSIA